MGQVRNTPPDDPNKPFTLNGIEFANRKEFDERVEQDAKALAQLLYDIYKDRKHETPPGAADPTKDQEIR